MPHLSFLRVRILSIRNPLQRYYGRRDLHFVTFRRVAHTNLSSRDAGKVYHSCTNGREPEQWVPHPSFLRVRILCMRNPLRRYYGRRDLHFVTFSCYRRRPYLGTRRARDQFVKVLDQVLPAGNSR